MATKKNIAPKTKRRIVAVLLILWGLLTAFLIYESFFHYVSLTEDTANSCVVSGGSTMTTGVPGKNRIIKVERSQAKPYINMARETNRCIHYTY